MDEAEREKRSRLFGRLRDGLRPIRPYEWEGLTSGGRLMEIPVTTAPLLRFPIHMSYLGFLGGRAPRLARAWLRGALAACRATGVEPSFLLHPLDFIGADVVKELSFFPGMDQPTERKLRLLDDMIDVLAEGFELTTLRAHAEAIRQRGPLARRTFDQVGPSTRPSAGGAL